MTISKQKSYTCGNWEIPLSVNRNSFQIYLFFLAENFLSHDEFIKWKFCVWLFRLRIYNYVVVEPLVMSADEVMWWIIINQRNLHAYWKTPKIDRRQKKTLKDFQLNLMFIKRWWQNKLSLILIDWIGNLQRCGNIDGN